MTLKEFKWLDTTSLQWFQEALLEQKHSLVRQKAEDVGEKGKAAAQAEAGWEMSDGEVCSV